MAPGAIQPCNACGRSLREEITGFEPARCGVILPRRLINGYQAFVDTRLPLERSRYRKLAESGQRPEIMVICCCDSRVSPEVIFDAYPGEMFVVRNIANLVPPYVPSELTTHGVSAALEFAVQILKVKHILVMGHTHCGGIRAFVEHRDHPVLGDFIDNWMSLIAPAAESVDAIGDPADADYLGRLEQASVIATLDNLKTFPEIGKRVAQGELALIGAYFDVGSGDLSLYDPRLGAFASIKQIAPR
jgi:carbonic anhydrase